MSRTRIEERLNQLYIGLEENYTGVIQAWTKLSPPPHAHTRTHACTHTHARMHTRTCTCVCIHTHSHTHTHACTHNTPACTCLKVSCWTVYLEVVFRKRYSLQLLWLYRWVSCLPNHQDIELRRRLVYRPLHVQGRHGGRRDLRDPADHLGLAGQVVLQGLVYLWDPMRKSE